MRFTITKASNNGSDECKLEGNISITQIQAPTTEAKLISSEAHRWMMVSPRPEKLSTRNDAIPISLKVFAQNSSRALEPPEPCWRIMAGNRPAAPWGNRNWPAIVTALPLLSPVKNCRADRMSVSMGL